MDLLKTFKIWRLLDKLVNTKFVASQYEQYRDIISRLAAIGPSPLRERAVPWTPFQKKLSACRLSVVTTAGIYLEGQEPFDTDRGAGDPSFREIPSACDTSSLKVAHLHYPLERALRDINVLLPFKSLRKLVEHRVLADLAPRFYSFGFGGGLTGEYINPPLGTAHLLAQELKKDGADVVLFIPA
ncbi:hypothetical protein ACFL27_08330 [candidate division CSSED10-310 bacterium]|uniref:D-proline reductase (Dithiol) PrdB n=1 Tax=candidate division CSSED10-310 bacterium TaxID=2855610 RepID=A0ABV6YVF0_UNCC1